MNAEHNTHFGYRAVTADEKTRLVDNVFRSVAERYDVMNDLMSFGIHRLWKDLAVQRCALRPGQQVLDLAGGTGDMTLRFARRVGAAGRVVLADLNEAMIGVGRDRLLDRGVLGNVEFVRANAESLPFADRQFHCVTIAFGLRNVADKARALREMTRVLRPGGRLVVLEFSHPVLAPLARLYDLYSFNVLPRMGQWVVGDAQSYQYLAESIRMHPDQDTLLQMLSDAGLEQCRYTNLTGGIVALHSGVRLS